MATVALVSNVSLINDPFLLKRLVVSGGTTGAAITHGESRSPDMVLANITTQTPTVTTVAVARTTSATTMTVDCLGDAADSIELYCIWLSQASGAVANP